MLFKNEVFSTSAYASQGRLNVRVQHECNAYILNIVYTKISLKPELFAFKQLSN